MAQGRARSGAQTGAIDERALARELARAGLKLDEVALGRLWLYHQLLRDRNPELNLTRIHNFENMVRKHYVDSLIVLQLLDQADVALPEPLLDLGTGPGLPGIPLAIARPQHRFILADGRKQRTDFVSQAVARLGLENVLVHTGRVSPGSDLQFRGVITRAVERTERTLERVRSLLPAGGLALLMKGPAGVAEAEAARDLPGYDLLLLREYTLPHSSDHRSLLVFQRNVSAASADPARPEIRIQSPDNARFRSLRALWSGREVKRAQQSILGGQRFIEELVQRSPQQIIALLVAENDSAALATVERWRSSIGAGKCETIIFARPLFAELNESGVSGPLAVVQAPALEAATAPAPQGCTLFLPLADPENLGAALRSAAAFGVAGAVCLREAANPYHPRALRSSAGLVFQLKLQAGPPLAELPDWCAQNSLPLFALDAAGQDLDGFQPPTRFGLVIGMEGVGFPKGFTCERIRIPIRPEVESLNAAAATAVALYALNVKIGSKK